MTKGSFSESVIRKIQLAKFLYDLGKECFRIMNNVQKMAAGIILLQDAVELLLMAVCEHCNVKLKDYTSFSTYFQKLKEKITDKDVPLEREMLKLNKQRVNIKHYGMLPHSNDCKDFLNSVKLFFSEMGHHYLNVNIESITLVDLLDEGEIKKLLKEAESYFRLGNYKECQINCRKALYLSFEKRFDIRPFEEQTGDTLLDLLQAGFCESPYYTKNREYIDKHVGNPIDYIQIDYNKLVKELLINNISPTDFRNVISLTPDIYYYKDEKKWVIKDEFRDYIYTRENAEYCLRKTVEILLQKQKSEARHRYVKGRPPKLIKISKKVRVYEKASPNSKIIRELTAQNKVSSFFKVRGLDDDKHYYYIVHIIKEKNDEKIPILGYICEDDVKVDDN